VDVVGQITKKNISHTSLSAISKNSIKHLNMSILDRLFVAFIAEPIICPCCNKHQSKLKTVIEAECYDNDDKEYWLNNLPEFSKYVGPYWREFMLTKVNNGYEPSNTYDETKEIMIWSFYSCQFCVHKFKRTNTTKVSEGGYYWPLCLP
jgi:hypothetical protein